MNALSICPDCSGYVPESTACPHCRVEAPRDSRAMRLLKRSLKFVAAGAMSVTVSACYGGPIGDSEIDSISVSSGSGSAIVVGSSLQFVATATLGDGTQMDITPSAIWATNSAGIATVVGGLVTGVSPGSASISAEQDGRLGSTTVTVTATFDEAQEPIAIEPGTLGDGPG